MLFSGVDNDVIIDLHEFANPVGLKDFMRQSGVHKIAESMNQTIFGYTVVESMKRDHPAILEKINTLSG